MFRFLLALLLLVAAVALGMSTHIDAQVNGERILFVRLATGDPHEELWTVAPDGSGEASLHVNVDSLYMADVSADGKQIVFGGAGALRTANIDGTNVTRLPFNIQEHSATWSPDGKQLVFTDIGPEGWTSDLYVANLDGSGRRLLVDATVGADFPDWSPDGGKIAFSMRTSELNAPRRVGRYSSSTLMALDSPNSLTTGVLSSRTGRQTGHELPLRVIVTNSVRSIR